MIHVFRQSSLANRGWSAYAGRECVREDALSARCKSVPECVEARKSKEAASSRDGVGSNRRCTFSPWVAEPVSAGLRGEPAHGWRRPE